MEGIRKTLVASGCRLQKTAKELPEIRYLFEI
jgi:hypothetical protein